MNSKKESLETTTNSFAGFLLTFFTSHVPPASPGPIRQLVIWVASNTTSNDSSTLQERVSLIKSQFFSLTIVNFKSHVWCAWLVYFFVQDYYDLIHTSQNQKCSLQKSMLFHSRSLFDILKSTLDLVKIFDLVNNLGNYQIPIYIANFRSI